MQQQDSSYASDQPTYAILPICSSDPHPSLSRSASLGCFSSIFTVHASSNIPLSNCAMYKKDIARKVSEYKLQNMLGEVSFSLKSSNIRMNKSLSNINERSVEKSRRRYPQQKSQQSMNKLKALLGEDVSFGLGTSANPSIKSRHNFHCTSTDSTNFKKIKSAPEMASSLGGKLGSISTIANDQTGINEEFPMPYNNSTMANNPSQDLSVRTLLYTE